MGGWRPREGGAHCKLTFLPCTGLVTSILWDLVGLFLLHFPYMIQTWVAKLRLKGLLHHKGNGV